jgi:ABC-2 type transport system ATP-binding protein
MPDRTEPVVIVKDIHKEFVLPQHKGNTLKHAFVNVVRRNNKTIQKVLDGVSFEINKGDFFGIVGRNGGGKSTLLKLLAGVYTPTAGSIEVRGGLTPFIELGVGFNPELSGRDNVYLNGALLGFTRSDMNAMYDEIVEFAELGPFMDQKLRNYSSGMQVRLAFSIAIKAKNEVLIFDEVLAVGDEAFQRKCLDVFERYKAEGQTVILVTHDMDTVRQFCNRALLLNEGKIVDIGSPRSVAQAYTDLNNASLEADTNAQNQRSGQGELSAEILGTDKTTKSFFEVGDELVVIVGWPDISGVKSVGVNIFKQTGEHVTGVNTLKDSVSIEGRQDVTCRIQLPITPGKYYVLAEAFKSVGRRVASTNASQPPSFVVKQRDVNWSGIYELPHRWS